MSRLMSENPRFLPFPPFPHPPSRRKRLRASPCSSEKVSPSAWILGSPLLSPCTPIHKRAETQAVRHPIGPTSAKNKPLAASAECRCAGQVAGRAKAVKLVGGEQASAATQRSQSVQEQEPPETMERETTSALVGCSPMAEGTSQLALGCNIFRCTFSGSAVTPAFWR